MTDSYPDKLGDAASREGVIAVICKPFDLTELRNLMLRIEELMAARCKPVDKE
jgi:hypothetical protein